jgi:hypothetical protein
MKLQSPSNKPATLLRIGMSFLLISICLQQFTPQSLRAADGLLFNFARGLSAGLAIAFNLLAMQARKQTGMSGSRLCGWLAGTR